MKKEIKQFSIVLVIAAVIGLGIGVVMKYYRLDWFRQDAEIRTEVLSIWYWKNADCRPAQSASLINCGGGKYIIHAKLDNGKILRLTAEYSSEDVKVGGKIL